MSRDTDYVIVGGGSAGCVLANRLSENPAHRVVLIEAGPPSDSWLVKMPAGSFPLNQDPKRNWLHMTEPDPTIDDRAGFWPAGKMLGGGSSLNGMVYLRGARHDYDGWAADGCTGWGWNDILPYFLRSEDFDGPASATHGKGGPLSVSAVRTVHPLCTAFLEACGQTGMPAVADYCAGDIDGSFMTLVTQRKGQRVSSARAHLGTAAGRPNLRVITDALVDRILFEGKRAVGVEFRHKHETTILRAHREIIVSAGTLQSPAVLMRSGIGPAAHLKAMGIEILVDAPEVGQNLQEHASFANSRLVTMPTFNTMTGPLQMARHLTEYILFGRGMLTSPPVQAMAHVRSDPDMAQPNVKLSMGPVCFDPATRALHKKAGVSVFVNISPPKSRGEIRLRSSDPADKPVIDHRLYGHADDMRAMISGLKSVDRIFESPAFAKYVVGYNLPPQPPKDDAEWESLIRHYSTVGFHAVATCRMGGDPQSVVDPTLKVRGVAGLRVIDASIMPVMPTTNTNAPAMMVAEKGADLIKLAAG